MTPRLGDAVWYKPDLKDPRFHDRGASQAMPAIIVKIWPRDVTSLQIMPENLDLTILHNGNYPVTFVPFVRHGNGIGEWTERT